MIRFAENLNKMIAAGLGGATEAPRTEVAVGHCVRYLEASGPVATFETNVAAPIQSLSVSLNPIQDLHGYDSPWPAGGGKNKYYFPDISETTEKGVTYSVKDGILSINGTVTEGLVFNDVLYSLPSNTYTASAQLISGSMSGANSSINFYTTDNVRKWLLAFGADGATTILTETGDVAKTYISINRGAVFNNAKIAFQFEEGSSMTAFAPYSNICPITGRDSVRVWRESAYDPNADPALTVQLGQTVYGGTLDISTGKLTVTHGEIASYNGEVLTGEWISDRDVYAAGTTPTIGAQVVYVLDTPQTIDLDPQQITTLKGANNVWSNSGDVALKYPYYEETEGY